MTIEKIYIAVNFLGMIAIIMYTLYLFFMLKWILNGKEYSKSLDYIIRIVTTIFIFLIFSVKAVISIVIKNAVVDNIAASFVSSLNVFLNLFLFIRHIKTKKDIKKQEKMKEETITGVDN